jgi:hypothetical protein
MKRMNQDKFSFEDLEVWQEAVVFADRCLSIIEKIETDRRHYRVIEQLESAATSPALNIAKVRAGFRKKNSSSFFISPEDPCSRLSRSWKYFGDGTG